MGVNIDEELAEGQRFEQSLGRMMLLWADIEMALQETLMYYARVKLKVARALFAGMRAKAMSDYIIAIGINTEVSEKRMGDLRFAIRQISSINTMRDRLAHHGSHILRIAREPGTRIISKHRANKTLDEFEVTVSSKMLEAMISDLFRIHRLLMNHTRPKFRLLEGSGDDSTWLYKSPLPENNRRKSAAGRSKQPRQRRSSPA